MKKSYILILIFLLFCCINTKTQTIPTYNFTIYDSAQTQGYYFLVGFTLLPPYTYAPTQMILDNKGHLVFYRIFGLGGPLGSSTDFKLQVNGWVSFYAGTKFYIMDSTFFIKDSLSAANGFNADPHEMVILSNGHYLLLASESRTMNLSSYYWFGQNHNQQGSANASVKGSVIQEFDANKTLLWEWKAHDHFLFPDVDSVWLNSPDNVDWTHSNAVEMDNDGNVLLSSRHFNEITKINKSTGAILWRMGGKRNQYTFTNDTIGFTGQHHIRRISNGNITLFDNGQYTDPPVCRAVEYSLNETSRTATLAWQYIYDPNMYSSAMGDVQRLSNSNTLVNFGFVDSGRPTFVVTMPNGTKIVEMKLPDGYATYRAFNYLTLPWQLNRPKIVCNLSGNNYYLTADSGYSSYKWSTGATTQTIQLTQAGIYYVYVNYGGGYISSSVYNIQSMTLPCSYIGIIPESNIIPAGYSLNQNYPNPFNPVTNLKFQVPGLSNVKIVVFDIRGREVETLVNEQLSPGFYEVNWDGTNYSSGVYYYKLVTENYSETRKMALIK